MTAEHYYRFRRGSRPNRVSLIILAITVAVTLGQFIYDGKDEWLTSKLELGLIDLWMGEAWRLLTVTLVHGSPFHILANGYGLWIMGRILEPAIGGRAFLLIYVVSALGGSIAIAMFGSVFTPTVGASGAIYGLFGAIIMYIYSKAGSFSALLQIPLGQQLLVMLAFNLYITFAIPGISILGHLGGLVPGAFLGFLVERYQSQRLVLGERIGGALLLLAIVGLTIYSVFPVHRGGYWLVRAKQAHDQAALLWQKGAQASRPALEHVERALLFVERAKKDVDHSKEYVEIRQRIETDILVLRDELKSEVPPPSPPSPAQ